MSKRLVAFFSASGNTKKIAPRHWQKQQEQICMRSHREVAYTSARSRTGCFDKKSRSSVEMKDKEIPAAELGGESLDIRPI